MIIMAQVRKKCASHFRHIDILVQIKLNLERFCYLMTKVILWLRIPFLKGYHLQNGSNHHISSHFMAIAIYTLIYLHWIWNNIPIYPDIPWKCDPWDATTHLARLVAKPWNVLPHTAGTSHCDSHLTMTWPSLLYGASTYLSDLI